MSQYYIKVTYTISPPEPGSDILIAVLGELGFDSFIQTNTGLEAFIPKADFNFDILPKHSEYDFYFTYEIETIEPNNWNAEWESRFTPVIVQNYCSIRAPFHPPNPTNLLDLIIVPKMSFGTGHHQTTWLMTKFLFENKPSQMNLLDMGCGTGILAILSKKLGAQSVVGIDIDEWSVINSKENEEINSVSGIHWILGDAKKIPSQKFDMILANINKNILKKDLPNYSAALSENGKIVMSGFFSNDATELKLCAEQLQLKFYFEDNKDGWALLSFTKN